MQEKSYDYFWNSNRDRYYDADSFGDWLRPFFRNGVFNGQLQVTANNDMSVTVGTGYGYINGKHRHFLTPTTLDLETASGTLHRIDNVVLRRDDTERRIYLLIVKGGNASSPVSPALTREGSVYDLKLAEIYVAAGTVRITQAEITDTRMISEVCGYVAATVKEIDFTQISIQFEQYFTNYRKKLSDEYLEYVRNVDDYNDQVAEGLFLMKQTFADYAGQQEELYQNWTVGQQENFGQWREEQESVFQNWYATNTAGWGKDFRSWFDALRLWFSDDAIGKIKMEIDALTSSFEKCILQEKIISSFPESVEGPEAENTLNEKVISAYLAYAIWQKLEQHIGDKTNKHEVTAAQVGLGHVNDTPDADKPVSTAQQAALNELYEQLTAYTRQKIADLINGASASMDTLAEIEKAMTEHKSVVDALDAAIGRKANAAEFDSHVKDSTAHVTLTERNYWNGKADGSHTHNYSAPGHTHDDRYYTEAEINNKLSGKADNGHSHEEYYTKAEANELKNSVSNGKAQVASAITAKGITTAANAAFATMANNIALIPKGTKIIGSAYNSGTAPNSVLAAIDFTVNFGIPDIYWTGYTKAYASVGIWCIGSKANVSKVDISGDITYSWSLDNRMVTESNTKGAMVTLALGAWSLNVKKNNYSIRVTTPGDGVNVYGVQGNVCAYILYGVTS